MEFGRGSRARTGDPLLPKQVRYQLRYTPIRIDRIIVIYGAFPVNGEERISVDSWGLILYNDFAVSIRSGKF